LQTATLNEVKDYNSQLIEARKTQMAQLQQLLAINQGQAAMISNLEARLGQAKSPRVSPINGRVGQIVRVRPETSGRPTSHSRRQESRPKELAARFTD
jgi:hypothetical protein